MACEEIRGASRACNVQSVFTGSRDGNPVPRRWRNDLSSSGRARVHTLAQTPRRGANCFGTNLRLVSRMPVMECGVNRPTDRPNASRRKRVAPTGRFRCFFSRRVSFASTVHGSRSFLRQTVVYNFDLTFKNTYVSACEIAGFLR